jgi:hypothetical protein
MTEQTQQTMPVPDQADNKPRTAAVAKPPVVDPEAPYGWIRDPKTGETRPKKRPGKQARAQPAPPNRAATSARDRPAPAKPKAKDYSEPLTDTIQGFWMLLAGIPTPDKPVKLAGVNVQALSIRAKAQAAVLEENSGNLVAAVNLVAQHNKQVQREVERWTADSSPAWVLPAMMAILPFAVQSAQVWRVPVAGDLTAMAKQTDAKFEELVKAMSRPSTIAETVSMVTGLAEEAANLNGQPASA